MGVSSSAPASALAGKPVPLGDTAPAVEAEKKPCKPCCACPETKRERDACIVEYGEENCKTLIEAHRECMKKMGFNI